MFGYTRFLEEEACYLYMIYNPKQNKHSKYGVSGVISTVLMVALTVILAAAVGSYVLNLSDELLQDTGNASITFDHEFDSFTGQYQVEWVLNSTQNIEEVEARGDIVPCDGSVPNEATTITDIGDSAVVCLPEDGGTVRIIGTTGDGNELVLQTYEVESAS